MNDELRGKIRNREYASKLRDFSGMRYDKITPTDIDGFVEFGDKLFVFMEGKHGTSTLPTGQRLAFERLVDACQVDGVRASVGLVYSHACGDDQDIPVADCKVTSIRFRRKWLSDFGELTVREVTDNAHAYFIQGAIELDYNERQLEFQIAHACKAVNNAMQNGERGKVPELFNRMRELIAQRTPDTVKKMEMSRGMWV